ncbi:DUF2975 domain-containing protein [Levilactobacillus parabrevis]|uniref:DUF2975 domain-containing protein n=1 Tax=Levilactobacillus parabrevis ATCC 53295 TaxID=1267003 RepID=A0A0R1GTF5_9LACO|nr:DUF2975 domain-containing protein [Levilactobacillus parabrevis]KRK37232.1 hypothetical protein FD07_GL000289 [Levilactobacillus parabrevis ATCC 53295]KRO06272.1 hypothetical protein IV61_GL000304 [Levilactobacillus parabrevis]
MRKQIVVLKGALGLAVVAVLALAVIVAPVILRVSSVELHQLAVALGQGLYVAIGLILCAIFEAFNLLRRIARGTAFSTESVKALGWIKWSAYGVTLTFTAVLPLIYLWADGEDAPGLLLFALILTAAALVVGVFANILEQLLLSVVVMKRENELMVWL